MYWAFYMAIHITTGGYIAFESCREQFTLLQEIIFYFNHAGRPRRNLTAARSLRDSVSWFVNVLQHSEYNVFRHFVSTALPVGPD